MFSNTSRNDFFGVHCLHHPWNWGIYGRLEILLQKNIRFWACRMQTVARCRVRDLNATGILSKSWNGCVGETYLAWQIIVGNIDVLRRQIKVKRHLFYERSLCKFLRNASRIKDGIVNNSLSQSSMHFCKSPRRVRSSKLPQLVHQVFMNYYNHNIFVKSADWDIDQPTNL